LFADGLAPERGLSLSCQSRKITEVIDGDKWDYADAVFVKGKGWVVGGWCPT